MVPDLLGDHVLEGLAVGHIGSGTGLSVLRSHAPALGDHEGIPHRLRIDVAAQTGAGHAVGLVGRAVAVEDALGGVDVVDAGQHLPVEALHVVGLREAVVDHLPVAVHRSDGGIGAPELVQVGPGDVGGDALQPVIQRLGVEVQVHEHQPGPSVHPHRHQRQVVVAQRAECSPGWDLAEPAGEIPRPAVVRAAQFARGRCRSPGRWCCPGGDRRSGSPAAHRRRPAPAGSSTGPAGARTSRRGWRCGRWCRPHATPWATSWCAPARRTQQRCSDGRGSSPGRRRPAERR